MTVGSVGTILSRLRLVVSAVVVKLDVKSVAVTETVNPDASTTPETMV